LFLLNIEDKGDEKMIFSLKKVREDLIEDVIEKVKDSFDKNYKKELTNIFYKCPELGISDTKILLKLESEYFQIINKYLQNIFYNIIELQKELSIRYGSKEIDLIKKSVTKFAESANEKFLLFIVCEQISFKTHTKELDLDFINKIEDNTSNSIKHELHNLILVIEEKKDKPKLIYKRRSYILSILSLGLSVVAICVSIIALLIIIFK
jgi:hypothetical protein